MMTSMPISMTWMTKDVRRAVRRPSFLGLHKEDEVRYENTWLFKKCPVLYGFG